MRERGVAFNESNQTSASNRNGRLWRRSVEKRSRDWIGVAGSISVPNFWHYNVHNISKGNMVAITIAARGKAPANAKSLPLTLNLEQDLKISDLKRALHATFPKVSESYLSYGAAAKCTSSFLQLGKGSRKNHQKGHSMMTRLLAILPALQIPQPFTWKISALKLAGKLYSWLNMLVIFTNLYVSQPLIFNTFSSFQTRLVLS